MPTAARRLRAAGTLLLALAALSRPADAQEPPVQYRSPAGVAYRALPSTDAIARAESAYAAAPTLANALQLGAAQSAARQFVAAVNTYTAALRQHPREATLYRWRGHRRLSIRDFDRARDDLSRAIELDSAIYGGWYHLGVLHFVKGDYADAVFAFGRALPLAPDSAERAGSVDWLWMSLMRTGDTTVANDLLRRRPDSVDAGNAYSRRLRLYRGDVGPDEVLTAADTADVQRTTLSYGVANWYRVRGDSVSARLWAERAVASGGWPGFAFMAAESELDGRASHRDREHFAQTRSACIEAIPKSAMRPVGISALAYVLDRPRGPKAETDALARIRKVIEQGATAFRRSLAGGSDIDWRSLEGRIEITVWNDGRNRVRQRTYQFRDLPAHRALISSLGSSLDSAFRASGTSFAWPAASGTDSVTAYVQIWRDDYPQAFMRENTRALRLNVPLTRVLAPVEQYVRPLANVQPAYPEANRAAAAEGTVVARFTVDTTGRIAPASIRLEPPAGRPRPEGPEALYFDAFAAEVMKVLPNLRYLPAAIGGCKLEAPTSQPFVFRMTAGRQR